MSNKMLEAFAFGGENALALVSENSFKSAMERYANDVSQDYIRRNADMNTAIAKIARANALNENQIQRVVEESNNRVYLAKYAQMKNSSDRDVSFDLASSEKVAAMMDSEVPDLRKIASAEGTSLDAFNGIKRKTGGITPAKGMSLTKIASAKMMDALDVALGEATKAHVAFEAQIYKVAEMMIRYDRAGIDIAPAYEEICYANKFGAPMQGIIQTAASEVVEMEKAALKIGNEYTLSLPYIDITEPRAEYGLGEFSKIACLDLYDKKVSSFPIMQIHKSLIKNIPDMVKFASAINTLFDCVTEKEQILKEAKEAASMLTKAGETIVENE